jgi:putative DNA primase/helicase
MIATMHGKRLVTASEASENSRLNEALIKRLTGMNQLVGRPIYGKSFTFEPEFKLYIDANHRPTIRGTDDAIWIRMRLIPFDVQFSKDQIDKNLWRKLRAELPGILAWAVAGCLDWQRDGLETPACITDAVTSYRSEQDLVGEYLADRTDPQSGSIPVKDLYADFRTWCTDTGERDTPKQRWFTDRVKDRYKMEHKRDGNYFVGVRLRSRVHEQDMTTWNVTPEVMQEENIQ